MFIVSITYTASLDHINKFIPEHITFLDACYQQGYFQLSGRKEPRTGGIILATVKSLDQLNSILAQDPFQKKNLAHYDIVEITPTKSSKALAFLVEA
jgi:uncharacterized protein YciI